MIESIDVLDVVGLNIWINSCGLEVMWIIFWFYEVFFVVIIYWFFYVNYGFGVFYF